MSDNTTLDEEKVEVRQFDSITDKVIGIETSPVAIDQVSQLHVGAVRPVIHGNWLAEAAVQLNAIQNLSDGWDSHGADRPDVNIVRSASSLLTDIFRAADIPKPHINPTPSGGVQFEWESGGRYFEIELVDPYVARYYYQNRDAQEESEGTIYDGEPLLVLVEFVRRVDSQS